MGKVKNNYDYYVTYKGTLLNAKKQIFQTMNGNFLRNVTDDEMEYYTKNLIPVEFPYGLPKKGLNLELSKPVKNRFAIFQTILNLF